MTLKQFYEKSSLRLLESSTDDLDEVKLLVENTSEEYLQAAVIVLDPGAGYLIRRVEYKSGLVAKVNGFQTIKEVWIPESVTRTMQSFESTATVSIADVNPTLSDTDLTVDFPEGARVDDGRTNVIHVWGKGAPVRTFSTLEQYNSDLDKRIASFPQTKADHSAETGRNWLAIVNVVILAVVGLLLWIRSRLARP